jgi:hypothetical protein
MAVGCSKSKSFLGFLTINEHPELGLIGGYLILNTAGRPVEFHCTAPIRPNRAQQILYGPTLEPYLFGEQIGRTLFEKSKVEPLLVCTDREPALSVREYVDVPVVLVLGSEEGGMDSREAAPPGSVRRLDEAHDVPSRLLAFHLGRNHLAVPAPMSADRELISRRLAELADVFDLAEPFGRIREAIEEARRGGQ